MAIQVDFQRPGQRGHDAHLGHSLAHEMDSRSPADGRRHLETLAINPSLQRQSVGLSLGWLPFLRFWAVHLIDLSYSPFYILPLRMAIKYVLIYIYIYVCVCIYIYDYFI
jgi:hypothetical protein